MGHRLLSDGTTKVRAKLPGLEAGEAVTGLGCWLHLGGVCTVSSFFLLQTPNPIKEEEHQVHRITSHFTQGQAELA